MLTIEKNHLSVVIDVRSDDDCHCSRETLVCSQSAPCLSKADVADISVNGECIEDFAETSTKNDATDTFDVIPTADNDVITVQRDRMHRIFFRPAADQDKVKQSEIATDEVVFDLMTRQMLVNSDRSRLLHSSSTARSSDSCSKLNSLVQNQFIHLLTDQKTCFLFMAVIK
jgi:hypothetical protein